MLKDVIGKGSKSLGYNVGESLISSGITEVDFESFMVGLEIALTGAHLKESESDRNNAIRALISYSADKSASGNRNRGKDFLQANALKSGVTTTTSGLQYEVLKSGEGPCPGLSDTVTTHYHGTTVDGVVFDSSVERNQPASFRLDQVIAGWTEALQLMNRGAKWKLYIPSELAYGSSGAGSIGPHSALVFEVELISF